MSKFNLDRTFTTTFPIQNYMAQFSLNYIYTHGDILECLNQSGADFKVFSLRNFHGWNRPILFSRMLHIAFADVSGATYVHRLLNLQSFLTGSMQGMKIRINSSQL